VILILGGPTFATLEVEIYRQAVNYFNLPLAALLSASCRWC
jgi:thiamine transport system permease protein